MAGSVSNASGAARELWRSIASRSIPFIEAKELLGSKVEYLTLDVNELSARRLGRFDIVLFFGVLYHLRHPLLGLEKAVELSTDLALIESFVIQRGEPPDPRRDGVLRAHRTGRPGRQLVRAVAGMPRQHVPVRRFRASGVERHHEPARVGGLQAALAGARSGARQLPPRNSMRSLTIELMCLCFIRLKMNICVVTSRAKNADLTPDSLFVEVDRLRHARAGRGGERQRTVIRRTAFGRRASIRARHEVRIRTRHSGRSNPAAFTMLDEAGRDVTRFERSLPAEAPELCSAEFRPSGDLRFAVNRGGSLVCYFRSRRTR